MNLTKMLEIANQVTDQTIAEVDAEYNQLEKKEGIYEVDGEKSATWMARLKTKFEADGWEATRLDEKHLLIQKGTR